MGKGVGVVKTKMTEDKLRKQLINRAMTEEAIGYLGYIFRIQPWMGSVISSKLM